MRESPEWPDERGLVLTNQDKTFLPYRIVTIDSTNLNRKGNRQGEEGLLASRRNSVFPGRAGIPDR